MLQKKIIIIGASSGIGREMAEIFASQGHLVGITGRRMDFLLQMQVKYPHQIIPACFDVAGQENRSEWQKLIQLLGGLDLFIYNAGFGNPSPELNWETEEMTTRINVNGFLELVNLAFAYFVKQGYGQIALTSSVAALRGNGWTPAYSASKAFMSNYAEGLNIKAHRLQKDIVITDIRPGFMDTKPARGNRQFWVVPARKAAQQIIAAIEKKKRVVYVSKRWWLVAQVLKIIPFWLYKRFV